MLTKPNKEDIKILRKNLGLTQEKFAEKLDVNPMTVYYWEKGKNKPGKSASIKIWQLIYAVENAQRILMSDNPDLDYGGNIK